MMNSAVLPSTVAEANPEVADGTASLAAKTKSSRVSDGTVNELIVSLDELVLDASESLSK